jgi:hypothetical protein
MSIISDCQYPVEIHPQNHRGVLSVIGIILRAKGSCFTSIANSLGIYSSPSFIITKAVKGLGNWTFSFRHAYN